MLRLSVRKVWDFLQTPVLMTPFRSIIQISMRELLLLLTIAALVGSLYLERKQHKETEQQLVREKRLRELFQTGNLLLQQQHARDAGIDLRVPPPPRIPSSFQHLHVDRPIPPPPLPHSPSSDQFQPHETIIR